MKANWKKIVLLLIALVFIFRECGFLSLHSYNMHVTHYAGKGSLQDGLLAGKVYELEMEWEEGLQKIGNHADIILLKETKREGLGWNAYRPLKKKAIATFEFDVFEKNKKRFLGQIQIKNGFEMKGFASGHKFKERVKAYTLRRLMKYLNEKCDYIDSGRDKEESSWLKCTELYTFNIEDGWDEKLPKEFKRSICADHLDSIQVDTFLFQNFNQLPIAYSHEVLTVYYNERIFIEVKRFFANGQLGFMGFYDTEVEPVENNIMTKSLRAVGIWRLWNSEGVETKSWDFDRMGGEISFY